jgi:hypothetical protein
LRLFEKHFMIGVSMLRQSPPKSPGSVDADMPNAGAAISADTERRQIQSRIAVSAKQVLECNDLVALGRRS